jgi:hypothetical protein
MRKLDLPASPFQALMSDGARLYLSDSHPGLWVSDGTAAGTRKISNEGPKDGLWTAFAGRLFYASSTGPLYTSDGTAAGTRPVRPDGEPRNAYRLLRFANRLIAVSAGDFWQSDGTAAGTKRISNGQGTFHVYIDVVKAGPRLFFPAWEKETGTELWAMQE